MQRTFKYGDIQNTSLTSDKQLNILICWTTSYVIIHRTYALLKMVHFFGPPCICYRYGTDKNPSRPIMCLVGHSVLFSQSVSVQFRSRLHKSQRRANLWDVGHPNLKFMCVVYNCTTDINQCIRRVIANLSKSPGIARYVTSIGPNRPAVHLTFLYSL